MRRARVDEDEKQEWSSKRAWLEGKEIKMKDKNNNMRKIYKLKLTPINYG